MAIMNKVISAVVLASATVLLHQTTPVDALCACPKIYYLPSQFAEMGAIVLRADVLSRSDVDDDATYVLDITTLYAGEPDVEYGDTISFVAAADTYNCRVDLKIGGDYLLGLTRRTPSGHSPDPDDSAQFELHPCGLNKPWSSVSERELEDLARLLDGDDDSSYAADDDGKW